VDASAFPRVSWKDLATRLAEAPSLVRGRLVLVGGDYSASGDDHHRVAGVARPISGLVLHGLATATVLDTHPLRDPPPAAVAAVTAGLAALMLLPGLVVARASRVAGAAVAIALAYGAATVALCRWGRVVYPVTPALLAALLTLTVGLLVRLRLPRAE
jgi:CHASE2 domain-containing sensor protein